MTDPATRSGPGPATMYSGLGYGPGVELEHTVRAFVLRADAVLPDDRETHRSCLRARQP